MGDGGYLGGGIGLSATRGFANLWTGWVGKRKLWAEWRLLVRLAELLFCWMELTLLICDSGFEMGDNDDNDDNDDGDGDGDGDGNGDRTQPSPAHFEKTMGTTCAFSIRIPSNPT